MFIKKTKKINIRGIILTEYSISWIPNGNMELMFSLKLFWLGFTKKDTKKVLKKDIKELNSVAGYCLGKLLKKNKLDVIFENEINVPSTRDWKNLKKILKLFSRCEYNNITNKILVNIIKIIGPEPEWKKFANTSADKTRKI